MLKNLTCRPGSFVEIVPVGLLCTLQYNSNGILQKIILGFDPVNHTDSDVFSPELTIRLKSENKVPQRIAFSVGTTWVKGVFYTRTLFKGEGFLPNCVQKDLLKELTKDSSDFTFYACDLHNDSYNFVGGVIIANRLSSFGFTVVPGYQVYDDLDVFPVERIMREKKSPFVFPYISGIMVYESCALAEYIPARLYQRVVKEIEEYQDERGYLRDILKFSSTTTDIPYSDLVKYDISTKSIVVLDMNQVIGSRKQASLLHTKVSRDKNCPICQRKMVVPHSGPSYCMDDHCPSRMYPDVKHLLDGLGLPELSFIEFKQLIKSEQLTCFIDVLSLDAYKDCVVETTLSNLLFSAVPFELCRGREFFQQFTNYLGSIEALDFYLENPDAIVTDLNLNKMYSKNFAEWLKDPVNVTHIRALIEMSDQIKIIPVSKKFEGAPIFKGKNICLTGKFRHGTTEDIVSILQSYSAKVSTSFDNTVNCVVIGHFEQEDRNITELAMSYGIPIYSEDDFFKAYEIDLDIRKQRDILNSYLE